MTGTWTVTPKETVRAGRTKRVYGEFTAASANTGGTVVTGLRMIRNMTFSNAVSATMPIATFSGGTATVTVGANDTGTFCAEGF